MSVELLKQWHVYLANKDSYGAEERVQIIEQFKKELNGNMNNRDGSSLENYL